MGEDRLTSFIQTNLSRGFSPEKIKEVLINHGWRQEIIDAALQKVNLDQAPQTGKKPASIRLFLNLWFWPVTWGIIFFFSVLLYEFIRSGKLTLLNFATGFAGAGAICIGISFALAPLSYYFSFFDRLIASRKGFGIVGFFLALAHSITLLFVFPNKYLYGFFANLTSWDFILGLFAMTILASMAAVSNGSAMRVIGIARWKFILRLGYLAYFLLIVRAFVIQGAQFAQWFSTFNGLPPTRLLAVFFATFVILLRIAMQISLMTKSKN